MSMYNRKVAEFTKDVTPDPVQEVWHTFEEYTAKVLYFHKGVFMKSGSSWTGGSLETALENAEIAAKETAEGLLIDADSTLHLMVVGVTEQYDRRLIRAANPDDRWDYARYDERGYGDKRIVNGPTVGWTSNPQYAELPEELADRDFHYL